MPKVFAKIFYYPMQDVESVEIEDTLEVQNLEIDAGRSICIYSEMYGKLLGNIFRESGHPEERGINVGKLCIYIRQSVNQLLPGDLMEFNDAGIKFAGDESVLLLDSPGA